MSGSENGGTGSLAGLYENYADWLLRSLVQRYGSPDAEDLTQDTWMK
ncbi:MAG: hypothetical protein EON58_22545, partial [Alphaproteobacteria bacterium]